MALYELNGTAPRLGRDVYVAESGVVIGDVELGDEASIWFGAVLRGDYRPIRVGPRTNVQDNAVLHITQTRDPTVVGADVTIGHAAIVHACTVGDRCLIGIGAIVLDGANVGEESFVGAGTLITPDTVIPPRSFVLGRPGKVVRPVRDEEIAAMRESAARYVTFARDFRKGCRRL
jgi:carbonic anhydrase/acetyltransferase-like protein (isoleucine patch superfamily)